MEDYQLSKVIGSFIMVIDRMKSEHKNEVAELQETNINLQGKLQDYDRYVRRKNEKIS